VRCAACRAEADEAAGGWRAYVVESADGEPIVFIFCPGAPSVSSAPCRGGASRISGPSTYGLHTIDSPVAFGETARATGEALGVALRPVSARLRVGDPPV
jgi:hypothetical protein